MITKSFLDSPEYQEFKEMLRDELELKPIHLKTEGKSNETIAREVTAHEFATKIVTKAMRKFERQLLGGTRKDESWV
jgi:DNA-binding MurR/RpiR family transcriptional regulator